MVDVVVVASNPANHQMSFATPNQPGYTAEIREQAKISRMPMSDRKIIARRATLELLPNDVVNLGIGMPEGVANVADEEGVLKFVTLTTEPGIHGGVGASGQDFGPAVNYSALLEMHQQFDFYNGGGLDVCFLGMADVNPIGDVNVTRVGNKLTGPGGFIDISQATKRINFVGTFTASGLRVSVKDGKLQIDSEGKLKKFVKSVPEVTFSAKQGIERNQFVQYITERCVFTLTPNGLELTEVAPGIDVQKQILDLMEFKPLMPKDGPRLMNSVIFRDARMGLGEKRFGLNLTERIHYEQKSNTVFVDFHGLSLTTADDVEKVLTFLEKLYEVTGKLNVVANYDHFDCRQELQQMYFDGVKELEVKYYLSVRRYSESAFRRHKLCCDLKMVAATDAATAGHDDARQRIRQAQDSLGSDRASDRAADAPKP